MANVKPEFPEGMFDNGEEKSLAVKLYGMFKQHLHNELGITKDYIDKIIIKTTEDRRKELEARYQKLPDDIGKAIGEKIGYTAEGSGPTDWFKAQVRQIILGEINEAIKGARLAGEQVSTFQEFVRKTVESEVRKTIVSKLKVDIKLDLIEPKEGELRELIGPEESFRGVRET
jgi:DNA-binding ferritin-like protein (Dps family)